MIQLTRINGWHTKDEDRWTIFVRPEAVSAIEDAQDTSCVTGEPISHVLLGLTQPFFGVVGRAEEIASRVESALMTPEERSFLGPPL